MVAATAPHESCPRITTSGMSRMSTPYSTDPRTPGSMTWPAGTDDKQVTKPTVEDDLGSHP
jgi:hypothetical protein